MPKGQQGLILTHIEIKAQTNIIVQRTQIKQDIFPYTIYHSED
jgi:hypothetical protein